MKLPTLTRILLVATVMLSIVGSGFAQMDEVADPVPYPEGVQLGDNPIVTFSLDELLVFKALDSYSEPAWVTELVEAGELPPVEERLPENPQVILNSGMSVGPGVYGGVWRDFSARRRKAGICARARRKAGSASTTSMGNHWSSPDPCSCAMTIWSRCRTWRRIGNGARTGCNW